MPNKRQTRYALFMAKMVWLGLKLVILTLKIKNARVGPPPDEDQIKTLIENNACSIRREN